MNKIFITASIITFLIAIYFAGIAYKIYLGGDLAYDLDEIYMNIGYCALFLSIGVYSLHLRDQKKQKR
ncbi:protein YpmT [Bacillus alveayuensis]|jgi:hypothetical protein|uniref:ABC-type nickel/cobalt efflux system permease component RcnA n=1 Tax=Aeribacillus alveayuensis TaxID=279215 RepID=A0ABT9VP62_9BACI|nr:protein YpmT [Bacillus alveayuensis]MDQ0162777.1 ABC-type nickel/cobalt efflux system permease component RcnA [Bacillus alveayuensis]